MLKFVAGNNLKSAILYGNNLINKNRQPIINYISENNNNKLKHYIEYNNLLNKISDDYIIALKLSSIDFDTKLLDKLISKLIKKKIKLIIDAENNSNIENYRTITNKLIYKYNKDRNNIIKTYQMYRCDSLDELNDDIKYYKKNNCNLIPKLVRGAYWHNENKEGHLFINKKDTDKTYNKAIKLCYYSNNPYNILATHNKESINLALNLNKNSIFQFANLMGMNNNTQLYIQDKYKDKKFLTATYIPYGPYKEMIPYLTRRLYENIDSIKYIFN